MGRCRITPVDTIADPAQKARLFRRLANNDNFRSMLVYSHFKNWDVLKSKCRLKLDFRTLGINETGDRMLSCLGGGRDCTTGLFFLRQTNYGGACEEILGANTDLSAI